MATATEQAGTIAPKNPATGEVLYEVPEATDSQIADAFARAHAAFDVVRKMSVAERCQEARKLLRYIRNHKESIVDRVVSETGKTRYDAMVAEIFATLDMVDYYIKNGEKLLRPQKLATPVLLMGKKGKIVFEPIGPVLIISPWNYPFNQAIQPFIGAFIAGNSVVYKPSEHTPLKGLIEQVFSESGFVKDAITVVYGGREVGQKLIAQRPAKIFFTGSTPAGKAIMKQAAEHVIPVELELGGKDPMIVFEDVDIERTVNGAMWGGLSNGGQICTAVERVYVQRPIFDDFVKTLREKIGNMSTPITQPDDSAGGRDLGYMTPDFQVHKVCEQLEDARAKGAEVVVNGDVVGHVVPPAVLTNVTPEMKAVREETFGPLLAVQPFDTEEEAITLANDSEYGLSASVWSRDLERAERVASAIVTGTVSINNVLSTQGHSGLPFGGTKQSGFGRFKGQFGLYSFSNIKSVMSEKQSNMLEVNWYPFTTEKYAQLIKFIDALFSESPLATVKGALAGMKLQKLSQKQRL